MTTSVTVEFHLINDCASHSLGFTTWWTCESCSGQWNGMQLISLGVKSGSVQHDRFQCCCGCSGYPTTNKHIVLDAWFKLVAGPHV